MDAVIVAAGAGTRMRPLTDDTHKCLLPINGRALVHYSLDTLFAQGIQRVYVVTGHCDQQLRAELGGRVHQFILNPFYRLTNNMASLWFAREHVQQDFIYLHADLLYHPDILTKFLAHPFSFASICVEEKTEFLGEEMKVGREGDRLILGKNIPNEQAFGEFIGIAAFKKDKFQLFVDVMTDMLASGGHNSYFAEAIAIASSTRKVDVVTISGLPWIEVDTPEDLERAREETFSKILAFTG